MIRTESHDGAAPARIMRCPGLSTPIVIGAFGDRRRLPLWPDVRRRPSFKNTFCAINIGLNEVAVMRHSRKLDVMTSSLPCRQARSS